MRFEPFNIAIVYQGKRRVLRVVHEPGAAIDIYRIEGKNRSIELETNLPLIRLLKRSTPHTWKIRGYIEDQNVINSIIKAIETQILGAKNNK